jgi:short subunit dehydrogenase-like uncharacterized protein
MDRQYDIVLFGATGFTGALTAAYLARTAGPDLRWALAGRNQGKLAALRDSLVADHPQLADLPLLHADATEPGTLRAVAGASRVVATTVGPYLQHGEPLVAACAQSGTDYLDITGEPEFVDLMYLRHHRRATETGARLVHCCGFDSIPHDLGAYFTVQQLPEGVPLRVEGYVRASGRMSGGTVHSALNAFARIRQGNRVARERRRAEPRPAGRRVHPIVGPPRHEAAAGGWVLPLPTIDPQVVLRSAAALDRYGPDFGYGHYLAVRHLPVAAGLAAAAGGLFTLAQVPPARSFLLSRVPAGTGPTPEQRAKSWFRVRFVGRTATAGGHAISGGASAASTPAGGTPAGSATAGNTAAGSAAAGGTPAGGATAGSAAAGGTMPGTAHRVVTEVSGGDPGYDETAKMLAESALCLALDDLPATSGQVTTAVAMGDALIGRLRAAGISFTVVQS